MKSIKHLLAILFATVLVSCTQFNQLVERVDDLEQRVKVLEQLCSRFNTNITSLQTIVEALQKNDYITGIEPVMEGDDVIGYVITFRFADSITIYHGKDGKDGENGKDGEDGEDGIGGGQMPVIGVKVWSDGLYYWTINGDWLLDEDGNMVLAQGQNGKDGEDGADGEDGKDGEDGNDGAPGANGENGKDGVTPQLKIEDGYWYISLDNGKTWSNVGKATGSDGKDGEDGDSFFQNVYYDSNYVTFVLQDGTILSVPRVSGFSILFEEVQSIPAMPGKSIKLPYQIVGADPQTQIDCVPSGDWEAEIVMENYSEGYLLAKVPANPSSGKILVIATSPISGTTMQSLTFSEGVITSTETFKVSQKSTTLAVPVETNLEYEISIPKEVDWIQYIETKSPVRVDTLLFSIHENKGATRIATISLLDNCNQILQSFEIIQEESLEIKNIVFADELVKSACVAAFDQNGDGELSMAEVQNVTIIPKNFFGSNNKNVTSFDELQYFNNLKTIDISAFEYCRNLKSITFPQSLEVIDVLAFNYCKSLKSITIPEGVKTIGRDAFSSCVLLESVTLPSTLESMGMRVFYGCSALKSISIPASLSSIEDSSFNGCQMLSEVTINQGVSAIEGYAFYGCTSMRNIVIPASVDSIGVCAFNNCTQLSSITIDVNNQKYDSRSNSNAIIESASNTLLLGCSETIIPSSVKAIASKAFSSCIGLKSIAIPASVTTIGEYCFENCSALSSVDIKGEIVSIDEALFYGCKSLKEINLPNSVKSIGYSAFYGCTSLESFVLPEALTTIGGRAFSACSNLKDITISANVSTIGTRAFYGCSSLSTLTIPQRVKSIGYYGLYTNNPQGTTFFIIPTTPPTLESSESDNNDYSTFSSPRSIKVHASAVDTYRGAKGWQQYADDIVANIN